jgi:hypothetical protein
VTTLVVEVDTTLSPKFGVIPEGHCQPGTEVGHAELSVGFSKVIPKKFTSKNEYTNTQKDLTGSWYT